MDFNYNSNHIEGNTLTYGQTEILLLFGKVICECVKIQNAYHFVIQTTIGRKNLDDIKDETEILRFALDDKKK